MMGTPHKDPVYGDVEVMTPQELQAAGLALKPQGPLAPQTFPEKEHAGIEKGMQDFLAKQGMDPARARQEAQRVGQKIPGTWKAVGGALLPLLVGKAIPAGRTIPRIGGQIAGNIAGRGLLEAGGEVAQPTGRGPLSAGLQGAAKGILPGIAQGTIGGVLGPTKDTLAVQRAMQGVQKTVSPEVAKLLDLTQPASLLSRRTVRQMQKAASQNLDVMEADIGASVGKMKFSMVIPGTKTRTPTGLTFQELRDQIKHLRDLGEAPYKSDELRGRARDNLRMAHEIESDMIQQLRMARKDDVISQYQTATGQYAADKDAIRWVRGFQAKQKGYGSVNLQDRPGLGQAQQAVEPTGSPVRGALHGTLGAAEALTGRTIGAAYHAGRASDLMRGGSRLSPAQRLGPLQGPLPGTLGGAGISGLQTLLSPSSKQQSTDAQSPATSGPLKIPPLSFQNPGRPRPEQSGEMAGLYPMSQVRQLAADPGAMAAGALRDATGKYVLPRLFSHFRDNLKLMSRQGASKEQFKNVLLNAEGHGVEIDRLRQYIPPESYPFN